MPKRQLKGTIVSNKMQKTVVVKVVKIKEHPRYKRRYKASKKYKAHDEKGKYKVGDKVIIEECKPLSKDKRWRVIKKITSQIGEGSGQVARVLREAETPDREPSGSPV